MASANKVMKLVPGVKDVVVEGVRMEEIDAAFDSELFRIVIDVRPYAWDRIRCLRCGRRCAAYDKDSKPKLWRCPDLNGIKTCLSYKRRRVLCPEHGVECEAVPLAFPATSFTRQFTSLVALLSMRLNRTAAAGMPRVNWRTAQSCVPKILRELVPDPRAGVRELDAKLKPLAADATDSERKKLQDSIGKARDEASRIKNTRYALDRNPENLMESQAMRLKCAVEASPRLARAHGLKELARLVFDSGSWDEARAVLKEFYWKAAHSRLEPFRKLAHSCNEHLEEIVNTVESGLSNARIEAMNSKIKLMIRRVNGFQVIDNLLSTKMLGCSNMRIPLPNRAGYGMTSC